jgi:hypothetical protein
MNFEEIQQLADSISRFTNKATTEELEELGRLFNSDHRIHIFIITKKNKKSIKFLLSDINTIK